MLKKHDLGITPYIENISSRDQSLVRMGTSRVTLKPWVANDQMKVILVQITKFCIQFIAKVKQEQLHPHLKVKVPSHSQLQGTNQQQHLLKIVFFLLIVISPLFIKPGWHLTDLHILLDLWQTHMVSLSESHGYGASVLIRTHFWENVKSFNIRTLIVPTGGLVIYQL